MTGIAAHGQGAGVAARVEQIVAPLFGGALPIRLRAWDGSAAGPPDAPAVLLRRRRALAHLLHAPGELGLARAYVSGDLDVDGDLAEVFGEVWDRVRAAGARAPGPTTMLAAVRAAVDLKLLTRAPAPPKTEARMRGALHSKLRDRRAISHHYDLSNDFYALLLDPSMAYSCGYWTSDDPGYGVADAQRDKADLVCRKLGVEPGTRLLDIGCGWGSLALPAAERHGAHVTAVTISAEQHRFVTERAAEMGLSDGVDVRLQDYRDIADEPFDAVASIEMGEHVGDARYPEYAAALHRLVRPRGRVLIQQMSRRKRPGGGPFIESYIAPDMSMRPVGATVDLLERAGLEVRDVHALREHYPRTIRAWYDRFEQQREQVLELVGEEVARVWRLYLVASALTFEQGRMGVDQILAVRRDSSGDAGFPAVR